MVKRNVYLPIIFSFILVGCSSEQSSGTTSQAIATDKSVFIPIEATIADAQAAFASKSMTCVQYGQYYVDRIAALDKMPVIDAGGIPLNSIIQINPHWREQALALDAAYSASGKPVGPLHCVPVLLKDLYDTFDFPTTASSLSLVGSQPPDDAFSVARMRKAGALILGKAAMTEFAYFTQSFNSRTLRIATPYDTTKDTGGSSGGTAAAIAANFGLTGTGSDTCASIRLPPSNNSLVGVRSSVGLVSQDGLIPLSHTQDVGGPITRTVRDAALMLDAMAGVDPSDPRTQDPERRQPASYTAYLNKDGLVGKRVGVLRSYGSTNAFGSSAAVDAVVEKAAADMAANGATIVNPVTLPNFSTISVILQEFADNMDGYLKSFNAPRKSTQDIFLSGMVHPVIEALIGASIASRDTSSQSYKDTLARRETMRAYVESEMNRLKLDVLIYPPVNAPAQPTGQDQGSNCAFSATTGMPSIVVPAGFTSDTRPLPVGVEIFGRKWDESTLFEVAYAYEQATHHRKPPVGYDK